MYLVGFLVGLAGLLFSYYIAKRDYRYKEMYCKVVSTNIISKSKSLFPKLSMKYDNQDLENLTITKINVKKIVYKHINQNIIENTKIWVIRVR